MTRSLQLPRNNDNDSDEREVIVSCGEKNSDPEARYPGIPADPAGCTSHAAKLHSC